MEKLKLTVDSLRVDTFTPADVHPEPGTVRAAEALSELPSYCDTECWPYCATGSWLCESINTCAGATGDCCKPSSNNVDCEI